MAKKPANNRPSLQLLIDRDLSKRFRALCLLKGTSASDVITHWMRKAVDAGDVPTVPKRTATPKRNSPVPGKGSRHSSPPKRGK